MGKFTKIWRKTLTGILSVIVLCLLLMVALLLPPVQNFVSDRAEIYLSRQLGAQVSIGKVRIAWFLDARFEEVRLADRKGKDLFTAAGVQLDIGALGLRERRLRIDRLLLDQPGFILVREQEGEATNIRFLLDFFSSEDTTARDPWLVSLKALSIRNGHFSFADLSRMVRYPGIDYDHVSVDSLDLELEEYRQKGDTNLFLIRHLAFRESSGFQLDTLRGDLLLSSSALEASGLRIVTPRSRLDLDLSFAFQGWNAFNDFIDSVHVRASIRPSKLFMADIGHFAPELLEMPNAVQLSGECRGRVSSFRARGMDITVGEHTRMLADLDVIGLPDVEETFVDARFHELSSLASGLESIRLPGNMPLGPLPEITHRLGQLSLTGAFTGFYNDFLAEARIRSPLGNVATDLVLQQLPGNKGLRYSGNVRAMPFDLGPLLAAEGTVGAMILDMQLDGSGLDWQSLDMNMKGVVDSLQFMGESINSILVDGRLTGKYFSGHLEVADELLGLLFDGSVDLREEKPVFDAIAEVKDLNISRLSNNKIPYPVYASGEIVLNMEGDDLDRLQGRVEGSRLELNGNGHRFRSRSLLLSFEPGVSGYRNVRLRSDFADADVEGEFLFADLVHSVIRHAYRLYPRAGWEHVPEPAGQGQQARIDVSVYDIQPLLSLFLPEWEVESGIRLRGEIITAPPELVMELEVPRLDISGTASEDLFLNASLGHSADSLTLRSRSMVLPGGTTIHDLWAGLEPGRDSLGFDLAWASREGTGLRDAWLKGFARLPDTAVLEARFTESGIPLDSLRWSFNTGHRIRVDTAGISFMDVRLANAAQMVRLQGRAGNERDSQLALQFGNFRLETLQWLLEPMGLRATGVTNGDVTIISALKNPRGFASLRIDKLSLNDDLLGDAEINADWQPEARRLHTDSRIIYQGNAGTNIPLEVNGFYYPDSDTLNFDMDIGVSNLKLSVFQPYLSSITSRLGGFLSGELQLDGTLRRPLLNGSLTARRASMLVDYLNEEYSFSHDISVSPGSFLVRDLILYDAKGNKAICNGGLYHEGFDSLRLDLGMRTEDFSVLNTTLSQNELFFGKGVATGVARFSGPLDDLLMEIQARTMKGTSVSIPISYDAEVSERGFITFTDPGEREEEEEEGRRISGLRLDFELEATPDATVEITLPARMGTIRGNGSGNLRFLIDTRGEFNIFGDYAVSGGYYDLMLQNLLSRRFELREGGMIRWDGDPYNATIGMTAVYRVRASLNELRPPGDSSELYKQRIPVNCVIGLSGPLTNPGIRFSFELPESSEEVNRIVYSRIDTANEARVSRQMISLLVLNSFISEETGVDLATGVSSSSFELLSRQLSNWLSQISKDFDIGVNYRPGGELTNEELELALSTQLFNDRVLINGNLGLAGDKNTQNASSLVGDVVVEVKLTEDGRFRVKAFNKSNYVDLVDNKAPYTQGVGVFYRKEFDRFRELFGGRRDPE